MDWRELLESVARGELSVPDALRRLHGAAVEDLGFARVDTERFKRCGLPEVVFCTGKSGEQVVRIMGAILDAGQDAMATRVGSELYETVRAAYPNAVYHEAANVVTVRQTPMPKPVGQVAVVTAGTSDIPVAEEAGLTAEQMGARVVRLFDVGVAGLHRLTRHLDLLRASRVVVVIAGMEGALPSVVGGLIDRPLIAVPTSVGYGLHLGGVAPLLAMLNTCVPGITVVNVNNGFGAGVAAAMVNRVGERES